MNLKTSQRKIAVLAIAGAAALLAAAFPAAAQPTNTTDFASFQVIAQRNIFDPNRVPHSHPNPSRALERVIDSFSLVGTMSYEKGSFAFFDGTSPDFRKVLEQGGDIAGFKITALAPKSVTLLSGTNETVLQVGSQLRRDDEGHWAASTEPASYTSTGNSYATGSGRHHRRHDGSARSSLSATSTTVADSSKTEDSSITDFEADTNAPDASALSGGGANDALARLMQRRVQEEQRLGSGQ
jgi:hypothetical protein